jgi:hypothetical protein
MRHLSLSGFGIQPVTGRFQFHTTPRQHMRDMFGNLRPLL